MRIVTNYKNLDDFYNWFKYQKMVAFDTEGTGLDPHSSRVLLIQVGNSSEQWVFDCYQIGDKHIIELLSRINSDDTLKILHNAKYDYSMIKVNYGIALENIADTMIASQLLNAGKKVEHNLAEVIDKYLGIKLNKVQQKTFQDMKFGDSFTNEQLEYAGLDVKFLCDVYVLLQKDLIAKGMEQLVNIEYECTKVTADLEINGIDINTEKWLKLRNVAKLEADEYKTLLDNEFRKYCEEDLWGNPVINYGSPLQIKPIFEKMLGHILESTDAKALESLRYDCKAIDLLINYRKFNKLISTYGEEFLNKNINPVTGKIHTSFFQLGADSGRYSSKSPNLQNIPGAKEYREPFEAPPGYDLISADYSNQEVRLLIHLCQDPGLQQAVKENKDLHSYSASLLFDIPYEKFLCYDAQGNIVYDKAGDPEIEPSMKKKYRKPAKSITFG